MSRASYLVSSSIIGEDYKTIYIGGMIHKAYPPTIKSICKAIRAFEPCSFENKSFLEIAENFSEIKKAYVTGLSYLISGSEDLAPFLDEITIDEMNKVFKVCFSMIDNSEFNVCDFEEERADPDSRTEIVGNKTLLGQIATFIDSLHLSYKEVTEEIPYRNLLIMQRDKLHPSYGQKVKTVSARDYMKERNKRRGK